MYFSLSLHFKLFLHCLAHKLPLVLERWHCTLHPKVVPILSFHSFAVCFSLYHGAGYFYSSAALFLKVHVCSIQLFQLPLCIFRARN